MPRVTDAIAQTLRERVGWNRIGVVVSLLIMTLAGITLYRLLHDIQIENVVAALRAKSIREVLVASCFVAGGFVTLTFYDFFALRTIGRKEVPYRTSALAGFASYPIGHNLGATVFHGGFVRLPSH